MSAEIDDDPLRRSDRLLAIALGYRPGTDLAPLVLATGDGRIARRIRAIAEAEGVPIHEDAELAALLEHVPLAAEIPPPLYPAIAEIFAFLWSLSRDDLVV